MDSLIPFLRLVKIADEHALYDCRDWTLLVTGSILLQAEIQEVDIPFNTLPDGWVWSDVTKYFRENDRWTAAYHAVTGD